MSTPRIDNAYKYPRRDRPSMNATLDSVYLEGQKLERELTEMRDKLAKLEQERDRLRLLGRELLADLRIVIDVARQNLPRAHGTIEGIAARLEVKSEWLEEQ
jgi:hypothetical protein